MALVKNLMSPNPICVDTEMTLEEIERVFVDHRITLAPVMDASNRILGVLTDYKLVKLFLRRAQQKQDHDLQLLKLTDFVDDLDPVVSVQENDSISQALKLVIQSPSHRVLVMDNGILSGVLSPKDLLSFLAGDERPKQSLNEAVISAQEQIEVLMRDLKKAKRSLGTFQDFFMNAPFMMMSVDFQGKVLIGNRMLHLALGYHEGELIGRDMVELFPHQIRSDILKDLAHLKVIGYNPLKATIMVKKDQSTIKVDLASMIRRSHDGRPISTITVARPTEDQNMLDYLRQAALKFNDEDFHF